LLIDRSRPADNTNHLHKLAVLHHHGVDNAYESLVRREETRPSCECISLEHTLTGVFGEDFDNSPSLGTTSDIPLKISPSDIEYSIELIRNQLVG